MKQLKRVGALIYVPLLFMFFGYLIIYIIGAPVINFATSAVELISLNDAPSFDQQSNNLLTQTKPERQNKAGTKEESKADGQENTEDNPDSIPNAESQLDKESISSSEIIYPASGDLFGEIIINKVGINEPLYYGDSEEILRLGSGQYIGSMIPGELGTTLIGGHNMPSFGKIYYLEPGDTIAIQTHYGEYIYEAKEIKIANYQSKEITERLGDRSKRSLILYTCYPLDAIGLTPERVFVFADYVSGPIIDEKT